MKSKWHRIGEEWPEPGQYCFLADFRCRSEEVRFISKEHGWEFFATCGNCDGTPTITYGPDGRDKAWPNLPGYTHWILIDVGLPEGACNSAAFPGGCCVENKAPS